MPYEIKERNNKFYVVDTSNNKIRGEYEDEDKAEDRKDELDFRESVRSRINRMPVTEMTAEEKAAEYDRMMAEKAKENKDPKVPPKKETPEPPEPPKQTRSRYWNTDEN